MPSLSFIPRYCFYCLNTQIKVGLKIIFINHCFKNILWNLTSSTGLRKRALLESRRERRKPWPGSWTTGRKAFVSLERFGSRKINLEGFLPRRKLLFAQESPGQIRVGLALPRQASALDSAGAFWDLISNSKIKPPRGKIQAGLLTHPVPHPPQGKVRGPHVTARRFEGPMERKEPTRASGNQSAADTRHCPTTSPRWRPPAGIPGKAKVELSGHAGLIQQGGAAITPRESGALGFLVGLN